VSETPAVTQGDEATAANSTSSAASASTASPGSDRADLRPENIQDAVIRLAGNSQDGIQTAGAFLARLAGRFTSIVTRITSIFCAKAASCFTIPTTSSQTSTISDSFMSACQLQV